MELWGPAFVLVGGALWAASFVVGLPLTLLAFLLLGLAAAVAGPLDRALGLLGVSMLCLMDLPMQFVLLHGGVFRYNTVNYWLLVMVTLYAPFLLRLRIAQCLIMELMVLLLAIGLVRSPDRWHGANQMLALVSWFGLLVYFARARRDPRIWIWVGLVNGALGAMGGLPCWFAAARSDAARPVNWFLFPLTAILSVCLAFPFASNRRRTQLVLVLLAGVNLVWIFLTARRSPLIVGGLCLAYLVFQLRTASQRAIVVVGAGLLACAVALAFPQAVGNTAGRFLTLLGAGHSARERTSGRWDLAMGGLRIFREHPLGVGTGGFRATWAALPLGEEMSGFRAGERFWSHSGWISAMAEHGVPGLLLLLAFVVSFAVTGYRKRRSGLLPFALMVTVVLGLGLCTESFLRTKGLLFLAAGATVALHGGMLQRGGHRGAGARKPERTAPQLAGQPAPADP